MSSFRYISKKSSGPNALEVLNLKTNTSEKTIRFKRGGSIKPSENIIPNGVLHEEYNKLGDKGMPVVSCGTSLNSCSKKYEIEKDEMIFTLAASKEVEKLINDKDISALGEYVKKQVLHNTHSFTNKFKELNNYKDESIFN